MGQIQQHLQYGGAGKGGELNSSRIVGWKMLFILIYPWTAVAVWLGELSCNW